MLVILKPCGRGIVMEVLCYVEEVSRAGARKCVWHRLHRAVPLAKYNARRNFAKIVEPAGRHAPDAAGNRFIVQNHDANRFLYDLRIEADGVLMCWAVDRKSVV